MPDHEASPAHHQARTPNGWLIALGWLAFLAFVTLLFNLGLQGWHNPNSQAALAEQEGFLTLKADGQGRYVAEGHLNGRPVEFLVDTGATVVSVPLWMAQEVGLSKGERVSVQTVKGSVQGWDTRVSSMRIGPLVAEDLRALITDGNQEVAHVVLGMSYLQDFHILQRDGRMQIRPLGN